jgi:spermidine/putrescine transport system ATP-binding protein
MGPSGDAGDLRLEGVTKTYDAFTAVQHLDLVIPQGSFFALLGPSGCGKTTTLRMVAGLEQPTAGSIHIGDRDITDTKPYQRGVNTVFQNYALFPHLNVLDNVAFGLRRRGVKDHKNKAMEALELVQLAHTAKKKPAQLSGGMQQRVALARAVVNRPDVLLLDEPLGALDLKLRRQMQLELKRIQSEVGLTFVHVTHDQEEAMTMADTIAVMNAGRLEQVGDPATLYELPRSTFAANFLGQSNLLQARVLRVEGSTAVLDVRGISLVLPAERLPGGSGALWLGVRPEKLRLVNGLAVPDGLNHVSGVVTDASFTGLATNYLVRMPWGQELTVVQQNDGMPRAAVGAQVSLAWAPEHGFALDADQDARAGAQQDDELETPGGIGRPGGLSGPGLSGPGLSEPGSLEATSNVTGAA